MSHTTEMLKVMTEKLKTEWLSFLIQDLECTEQNYQVENGKQKSSE